MEPQHTQHIKSNAQSQGSQRFDQKVLLYLTFVGIATAFWFLIKLGSVFNSVVKYPITFVNIPGQKVVVNKLPDNLVLAIKANGFSILRYKINGPGQPLVIDMQRFNHQIGKRKVKEFNLLTRNITTDIKNQLPTDIDLVSVLPDTIPFVFSIIAEKKVPVKPDVILKFGKQCNLEGAITFIPDSVVVNGPDILLDTLKAVYTSREMFTGLKRNIRKGIELKPIEGINIGQKTVLMQIPVAKFTEAIINVPVNCTNVPDSLVIKTIPDMVMLRLMVSLSNFNQIEASDFRAEVDASNFNTQLNYQLPVRLVRYPENVYDIKVTPEQVSYILEAKQ